MRTRYDKSQTPAAESTHPASDTDLPRSVVRPRNAVVGRLLPLVAVIVLQNPAFADPRPNVLWITAEDMSPTLGCYGDSFATTPHIDALARDSVRYTHAMATSPVCSPSRSCLINGCIASSQGTHNMRSEFPIPAEMSGFPALLRTQGYYTTNNVKTDYNSGNTDDITRASWNESSEQAHWRSRDKNASFFAVFNLMTSHQSRSMVWSYDQFQDEVQSRLSDEEIHDPDLVPLPPYYPDTQLVRRTVARYYDCVTAMDKEVGRILDELQSDGLADDTIVFFYSDHGSGMPRHKRLLLDSGMHVPLLIRFPPKYQHLAPADPGGSVDRLVCFDDFGPTVLNLAGVESRPDFMTGQPFLGPNSQAQRRYVYGHRDRVDEVIDMARSVRDHRYLYIRNYMPHLGNNQQSAWVDQGEMIHEFYRLASSGSITPAQRQFVGPSRPIEELYDCLRDPLNLANLCESAEHQEILSRMRAEHRDWILRSRDLGFLPETEQWRIAAETIPMQWAVTDRYRLPAIFNIATQVGTDDLRTFARGLSDDDPAIRYWGALGMTAASELDESSVAALTASLTDPSAIVQIESATALAHHGHAGRALVILANLIKGDDTTTLLHAARAVELIGDEASALHADMQDLFDRYEKDPSDAAWFIRFTTTGYLDRVKPAQPAR
jgi:N-sulfoglucosamine sulfohydrolase